MPMCVQSFVHIYTHISAFFPTDMESCFMKPLYREGFTESLCRLQEVPRGLHGSFSGALQSPWAFVGDL